MSDNPIARVRYYDRQILRTSDFIDEQAYHLAQRRRHNIAGHVWGIVYGLEVVQDENGALGVQAGMAVDGYGRELILNHYQPIDAQVFDDKGSELLDVFLEYTQQPGQQGSTGAGRCDDRTSMANRIHEGVRLLIQKASSTQRLQPGIDLPERRQPDEVAVDDLRFSPERVPPDSPTRRWPVFLGQLRRGSDPLVSLAGRPYAGLRGELIRAASDWAWLQLGEWPDNDYHFGIFLANQSTSDQAAQPETPPLGPPAPVLGVKAARPAAPGSPPGLPLIELRAETHVAGDLLLEGGALEFGGGPAPDTARPWRIYHVAKNGDALASVAADTTSHDELRIEMAASDDPNLINEVVIGHWSAEENDFVPCLTVGDDCNVTVHRNLVVNGTIAPLNTKDATSAELIQYVVRRTRDKTSPVQPAWYATLVDELDHPPSMLPNSFLPFLVEKLSALDHFDLLVTQLGSLNSGATLLEELAKQANASFVSDYLTTMATLVQQGILPAKQLGNTLASLIQTITDTAFQTAFLSEVGKQVDRNDQFRAALIKALMQFAKRKQPRDELVENLIGEIKKQTELGKDLLAGLVVQASTDKPTLDALIKAIVAQPGLAAIIRDKLPAA